MIILTFMECKNQLIRVFLRAFSQLFSNLLVFEFLVHSYF